MTANDQGSDRIADERAIRKLVADADALQSDVDGFTRLLADAVVIVNIAGIRIAGRSAFREAMSGALETSLAKVTTRSELEDITFVGPDTAVVSCVKYIFDGNAQETAEEPAKGSLSFVVVRQGDGWRIVLAQTTPIPG
jgi:uncharacterized protein (TIGR02246 family)